MTDEKLTLGMMLKIARVKRHLSQKEAADLLGINRTQFGKYERNENYPVTHKLLILAEFIGVSVDTLLRLNPERNYLGGTISKAIFSASFETVARVTDWICCYILTGVQMIEGKRPFLTYDEIEKSVWTALHSRYKKAQLGKGFKRYTDEESGIENLFADYNAVAWPDVVKTVQGMKEHSTFSLEWNVYKNYRALFMTSGRIGESPRVVVGRRFGIDPVSIGNIVNRFPENLGRLYEQRFFLGGF